MSKWFSPSGGLFYHFKALRFSKKLWEEFRQNIYEAETDWLSRLSPSQKRHLVLIGGSGGHVQRKEFLTSFEKIVHVDIDPYAKFYFRRNFANLNTTLLTQSAFKNGSLDKKLLDNYSPENSAWLFSNLLGQMGLYHDEKDTNKLLKNVIEQMSERSWMSFHDLYSTMAPLKELQLKAVYESWEETQKDIQTLNRPSLELADHLTHGVFPFHSKKVLLWPLTPTQIHFVEVGWCLKINDGKFAEPNSP